jgi:SpoVK/Ycf46/Vps4 family AAA+-type ATPase
MQYFHIIQALCRSALASPSNAIVQQIERLKECLEKDGLKKEAASLSSLLSSTSKSIEMAPSRIERSFVLLGGEELTSKVHVPVDKESSTPLAEIIFTKDIQSEAPLFSKNVQLAIESILQEWVHYDKLSNILAQPSRSCLIYGAPGTGKTHLALWIAKQINIPVVLARLDGLMSSFLGTTSRNIGNLFAFAARYRCILLLDEFDAIAKLRNDPQEVGEIKRVVNTLLQNLDGRKNIGFTIGVTNHESLLDPAIWRRFEVQIEIPKPSIEVILSIIKRWQAPLEFNETEIKFLAWSVENSSGADVESMIKWLKKASILESESTNLIERIRKFTLLNSGRIDEAKKTILTLSDEEVAALLLGDSRFSFKQKDLAVLVDKTPSAFNKILSKLK